MTENDYPLFDDDQGSSQADYGQMESDNLRKVREWGKAQERRAADEARKREELEAKVAEFEAKQQRAEAEARIKEAGLSESQVASLLALNPNPSPEAIDQFKEAFITNALPKDDENQPEDLMPFTSPSTLKVPDGPPVPISGGIPASKAFSTEDFIAAAQRGDESALRQMAAAAAKDPSRLKLKHAEKIPTFD